MFGIQSALHPLGVCVGLVLYLVMRTRVVELNVTVRTQASDTKFLEDNGFSCLVGRCHRRLGLRCCRSRQQERISTVDMFIYPLKTPLFDGPIRSRKVLLDVRYTSNWCLHSTYKLRIPVPRQPIRDSSGSGHVANIP